MQGKFIVNTPWTLSAGTDVGGTTLKANTDIAGPVDVKDLDQLQIFVACTNFGTSGTCTILVQSSIDGVNWVTEATLTQSTLTAAGVAARTSISDSHGMSVPVKQVQVSMTAVANGFQAIAGHSGIQRKTYS